MSKTVEQFIQESVTAALQGDGFQQMIQEALQKEIKKSIESCFGYGGEAKKMLDEKIKGIIIPAVERHDFNNYIVKVEDILTDIVNSTDLADNKVILDNFKELMCTEEFKIGAEITLEEIFDKWADFVSRTIEGHHLKAACDGEPYYESIEVRMQVISDEKYFSSSFDDVTVRFICDEDEDLNFEMKLYKSSKEREEKYGILRTSMSEDISDLRNIDLFEIYINKLRRSHCKVVVDKREDTIEITDFEAKPEWTLE